MQVLSHTLQEVHPEKSLLMVEIAYTTKAHTHHSKKLRMCIDTAADVNVMPVIVYRMVFQDPHLKSLKSTNMTLGAYTNSEIPVLGKCTLHLQHPETKKYMLTTFYVAGHEGSVLLSCRSSFELDVIRVRPRISNSAPRSTVITSKVDHPKHTKKYEKIPQPAPRKNKQKPIPTPRQSKLYKTTAKPMPFIRPVPAPRRSLKKEVIHNNLKPGNEVICHNTKPAKTSQ